MSWLDNYRTASFRGVEFKVRAHNADEGRRTFTHEFPQRDVPFTEDLGKRAGEYVLDGYVIGDDYFAQRDRLREACLQPGIGELVHPYLGSIEVVCVGLRTTEATEEGRLCRFELRFIDAGLPKYPSSEGDAVRAVSGSGNNLTDVVKTSFASKFLTGGFVSFVGEAAAGLVSGFSDLLQNLPFNPLATAQVVAAFLDRVRSMGNNSVSLVTTPDVLATDMVGLIREVREVYQDRAPLVLRTLRESYDEPFVTVAQTAGRRQEGVNYDAFHGLIRQVTIAEQASIAVLQAEESAELIAASAERGGGVVLGSAGSSSATTIAAGAAIFQTRDEAIAVRDALVEALDVELEHPATSDEVFIALTDLRAKVVRSIPSPDLRLPRVLNVTPPATLPSLVMAWRLYENAGRSVEIADRNKAPHPGFLLGGRPLEVISDAE